MSDPEPTQIPDPPISLVLDRRSQREQIEAVLERAQARKEPVRVRIPVSLFSYEESRSYVALAGAVWNLQLPIDQTRPETIEKLIQTIGKCIVAIASLGSAEVVKRLEAEG